MKNLLKSLLRLIGRAKIADLNNDGKIDTLQEEIQGLFSQFRTMSDTLEDANNQLAEVLEDEEQKQISEKKRLERIKEEIDIKIQESQARQARVKTNIDRNAKLKSKVDEFTA